MVKVKVKVKGFMSKVGLGLFYVWFLRGWKTCHGRFVIGYRGYRGYRRHQRPLYQGTVGYRDFVFNGGPDYAEEV